MALVTIPANPIWVAVCDRAAEGTDFVIKQKVLYQGHIFQEDALGNCTLLVEVLVYAFAQGENDTYGQALNVLGIMPRRLHLSAANDTLVKAETGEVLQVFATPQTAEQLRAAAAAYSVDVMLQGQFFQGLRDNGFAGTERELLIRYIRLADAAGKFA